MKNKAGKTPEQLKEYYEKNYQTKSAAEMAKELGCLVKTVYTTAHRLGLVKPSKHNFTKEQIEQYLKKNLNTKNIKDIAKKLGYSQRHIFNLAKSLSLKKDNNHISNTPMTETQYNIIKTAFAEAKTKKEKRKVWNIASKAGVEINPYNKFKTKIIISKDYQEFLALATKKITREVAKEKKAIRENTAKVNQAIFPKKHKPKNPPNKAVNTKKAGMTTRAIKALKEEQEKEKALKEYTEKLGSQLNAKDENELSVNIRVQVGKSYYILERKKYDTPEKIEEFKQRKIQQEQQRIETINQNFKKTPKQEF